MAWKVTSLRKPWERNRLLTMHSWTMSSLPASWRLWKFESVCPMREKRMNSRGKSVTAYSYVLVALKRFLAFKRTLFSKVPSFVGSITGVNCTDYMISDKIFELLPKLEITWLTC